MALHQLVFAWLRLFPLISVRIDLGAHHQNFLISFWDFKYFICFFPILSFWCTFTLIKVEFRMKDNKLFLSFMSKMFWTLLINEMCKCCRACLVAKANIQIPNELSTNCQLCRFNRITIWLSMSPTVDFPTFLKRVFTLYLLLHQHRPALIALYMGINAMSYSFVHLSLFAVIWKVIISSHFIFDTFNPSCHPYFTSSR